MKLLLALALAASVLAVCPPNTFTCRDGTCIPEDWVGDGEPDCDDRSDETVLVGNSSTSEDPFDEIVTVATTERTENRVSDVTTAPNTTEDCPYEHQLRVDECSEPIQLFIHEVNAIYFENSSLLADRGMQQKIEKGCDLMNEYNICVQGASSSCQPDEGVRAWHDVEMYACQLLIPAVREHDTCFSTGRNAKCSVRFDPLASPFCRLVTSVSQDVNCILKYKGSCSEEALEMLPPILEESDHIAESIRCRIPSNEPTATSEIPTETSLETTEEEHISIPTRPTTTIDFAQDTDMTSVAIETEADTTIEVTTSTKPSIEKSQEGIDEEKKTPLKELSVNMSEAVNAMYYIYDVCSSDFKKSHFAIVAEKICARQDEIAKYSDCYQKTLEKMKCHTREAKNECQALEAFNTNLDCAIVTMNDACEVEAQNFVVDLQETINDVIIEKKCFNEQNKKEEEMKKEGGPSEFSLQSTLPKCTEEQENGALACLVELVEINKQLAQFQNLNFLLEIASPNSTVVENICNLFGRYEQCLSVSVFKNGQRCSFASPLNTLARIGLAPICSLDTRPLLASHRPCLMKLAEKSNAETNCQSGLGGLGNTVQMMLQGIHGEALLCKSFYLLRDTFKCGEKAVEHNCDAKALKDLGSLKDKMTALGLEEGCPETQPANLDEIIARPVKKPQPVVLPSAPQARPIAPPPQPPVPPPRPASPAACLPEEQKKFEQCVRPLTSFQPHPLSVIKMPRQIDEACTEFAKFKTCVADVNCHPLWAKGMTAMFEFACGEGAEGYKNVRQCIRKIASEDVVRECVATFSRGAPTMACLSANKLLSCSLGPIQTECGNEGAEWVSAYVTKFATAIDSRCKLSSQLPIGKVIGVGCTAEEEAIIEHCAAPLNDIGSRMEELFQGGLQSMIKNVNSLAPVFAGGCNLTDEFRTCASFLLSGRSPCVVSSCMIKAGDGICDQPDPSKAIDTHLSCVFGQIQEPTFAKCVRSTLSTVKQFTLSSFRNVLPKFIDCTQEIVLAKCGETPINVLRAMSSPDICPVGSVAERKEPIRVSPQPQTCTTEKKSSYEQCAGSFYSKYRLLPVALLDEVDNLDQVCKEVEGIDSCSVSTRICATSEHIALKKMVMSICNSKSTMEKHKICLKTVATGQNGTACMSEFMSSSPEDRCVALTNSAKCMSTHLLSQCGQDALAYSYAMMSDYALIAYPKCSISTPSVQLETGCTEEDMYQFLNCESTIDRFSFRPVSIIGDASQLDAFCNVFNQEYRPCLEKMKCKFEPATSVNIRLMDDVCNKPVSRREQTKYGDCLSNYTRTEEGRHCIEPMAAIDQLAKDAQQKMCPTLNSVLSCASADIEKKCGYDALLHVYDLHIQWATGFNKQCIIQSPEPKNLPTNSLDESRDSVPQTVVQDDTTPPSPMTESTTEATTQTTTHPKDVTTIKGSALATFSVLVLTVLFF